MYKPLSLDSDDRTPEIPHHRVAQYIRAFSSFHGINSNDIENSRIRYNTRVELVERRFNSTENGQVRSGWTLTLKEMVRTGRNTSTAVWTKEECISSFDPPTGYLSVSWNNRTSMQWLLQRGDSMRPMSRTYLGYRPGRISSQTG